MNCVVLLTVIFIWLEIVHNSLSAYNSSKLCGKLASSPFQVGNQNLSIAECKIKYLQHSLECEEWKFEGSPEQKLGVVKLDAYVHTIEYFIKPAFNVSFHHIKWNSVRLRFRGKSVNNSRNMCWQFHLPVKLADSEQLYYDCPWAGHSEHNYKGKHFSFEYEVQGANGQREHGIFSLQVPSNWTEENDTNITDWLLFVHLDETRAPELTVHWTAAPRWLKGVQYDGYSYNVTVHHGASPGSPEVVHLLGVVGANQDLRLMHDVGYTPGAYHFGVQLIHPACGDAGCLRAFSPLVIVEGHSRFFIIMVIGCTLLIPCVLCILYLLVRWLKRPITDVKPPPVVLIIYVPTYKAHVQVVRELAVYLNSYCGVEVLLHDINVPMENVQELQSWLSGAFERADFVMVVSSPLQHTDLRETIYVNAGELGLKLLRLKFADRNTPPENFFCVVLPYCDKQDLPKDVVHCRTFHLMHQLDKLLRFLHGGGGGFSKKVLSVLQRNPPGGSYRYQEHGGQLTTAIDEATSKLQKDPPVAISVTKTVDSPLSAQSAVPLVFEESVNLLERYLDVETPARIHSPFYPGNMLPVANVESNQPSRKPTKRRVINANMKL